MHFTHQKMHSPVSQPVKLLANGSSRVEFYTPVNPYGPQEMATQGSSSPTCVSPSPAGPAGCQPLNFLNLVNLSKWVFSKARIFLLVDLQTLLL